MQVLSAINLNKKEKLAISLTILGQ